jgi:hypothetical protein
MSSIKSIITKLNNHDIRFIPKYYKATKNIKHGKYITNEYFDNNDIISYASMINENINKCSVDKKLEKLKYAMVQCSNNPLSEKAKFLIFSDSDTNSNLVVLINSNEIENNFSIEYPLGTLQ